MQKHVLDNTIASNLIYHQRSNWYTGYKESFH